MKNPMLVAAALAAFGMATAQAQNERTIGSVSTNFRLLGANDKVMVERFEDPKINNVACFASFARTGGFKGSLGIATDPSRFALSCVADGPVTVPPDLPRREQVAAIKASFLVKHFNLYRLTGPGHKSLVYILISTKIIHGSPANAISAVPVAGG